MTSAAIIAGVMSGTSLDGLDIAICRFKEAENLWEFEILAATTLPYNDQWKMQLSNAMSASALELAVLNTAFGSHIGNCVKQFCSEHNITPQLVASHGHTIFHQPENQLTFQVGSGACIAASSGIDTICDFRSTDVALSGQGAPLVPVGDALLFQGHRFCLNLGGIANISFDKNGIRTAFDICPVNIILNALANEKGKAFDESGKMAVEGTIDKELLQKLNSLEFYEHLPPKSLGKEWVDAIFMPVVKNSNSSTSDKLRTVCEHIAIQIAKAVYSQPGTTMFTTGGGAFNNFLVELINEKLSPHGIHVVVPDSQIVNFKEALSFAFLGLLRSLNRVNVLSSVTGAGKNTVSGCVYIAPK